MKSRQTDFTDPAVVAFYRATLDCQLVRNVLQGDQPGALRNAVNGLAFAIEALADGLIEMREKPLKTKVTQPNKRGDSQGG